MITFVEYHNKQQILPCLFPCVFSSTPSYETLHIICLMTVPDSDVERLCQDQKNHKPSNWSLSVNQEEKRYLIVPSTCTCGLSELKAQTNIVVQRPSTNFLVFPLLLTNNWATFKSKLAHSILGWKELKFVRITFCCQKLLSNFQDIFYSYIKAELIKKFCDWCSGEHYGLWASYIYIVYVWRIKCLREFFHQGWALIKEGWLSMN